MRLRALLNLLGTLLALTSSLSGATIVSHREFQAVDEKGNSTFIKSGIQEVQLEGILLNGMPLTGQQARLYVPTGFPDREGSPKQDEAYEDPRTSPVTWVVYSHGPYADPNEVLWDLIKRKHGPVPRRCWYQPHERRGLIVRMRLKNGGHIGTFESKGIDP